MTRPITAKEPPMTDTTTPITPTPEWTAAVKARFWSESAPLTDAIGWNEIVQRSGHSSTTLWRWRREGKFPFFPIASRTTETGTMPQLFYDRAPVERWLAAINGEWNNQEAA